MFIYTISDIFGMFLIFLMVVCLFVGIVVPKIRGWFK